MSNTTKREMVTEMKPDKTDKEDNAEERRSVRSRRVNYTKKRKNSHKEENQIM